MSRKPWYNVDLASNKIELDFSMEMFYMSGLEADKATFLTLRRLLKKTQA